MPISMVGWEVSSGPLEPYPDLSVQCLRSLLACWDIHCWWYWGVISYLHPRAIAGDPRLCPAALHCGLRCCFGAFAGAWKSPLLGGVLNVPAQSVFGDSFASCGSSSPASGVVSVLVLSVCRPSSFRILECMYRISIRFANHLFRGISLSSLFGGWSVLGTPIRELLRLRLHGHSG